MIKKRFANNFFLTVGKTVEPAPVLPLTAYIKNLTELFKESIQKMTSHFDNTTAFKLCAYLFNCSYR